MNINLNAAQTKFVTSHALSNGNIVNVNGGLFRLRDRMAYEDKQNVGGGDIVAFQVDVLEAGSCIPKSWLKDYTIQGNGYATWARVIDTEILTKYM